MTDRARALAAALLLAGVAAMAIPADAVAQTGAPSCAGVWVVVDPGPLGGSADLRCAPGDPSSGIAALRAAGHTPTYVPNIPGFVCTIDGLPDPCNGAPPHAYWSYWWASAGGTWRYAVAGAGQRDPAPGEVEGWVFGDGTRPPTVSPPAVEPVPSAPDEPPAEPAPSPAPPSDPPPTTPDRGTGGEPDASPRPEPDQSEGSGAVEEPLAPGGTATEDAPGSAKTPSSGTSSDPRTAGAPLDGDARPAADGADPEALAPAGAEQRGGAPASLILGLGLLALTVAATWWRARRSPT